MSWIELSWIELSWVALKCVELSWVESSWVEVNRVELIWVELSWSGGGESSRVEHSWVESVRDEKNRVELSWQLSWAELNWIELKRVVLSRVKPELIIVRNIQSMPKTLEAYVWACQPWESQQAHRTPFCWGKKVNHHSLTMCSHIQHNKEKINRV